MTMSENENDGNGVCCNGNENGMSNEYNVSDNEILWNEEEEKKWEEEEEAKMWKWQ